jgi:hypothetical protein
LGSSAVGWRQAGRKAEPAQQEQDDAEAELNF